MPTSVYSSTPATIPLPTKLPAPVMTGGDALWEQPYNRVQVFGSVIPPGVVPYDTEPLWRMFYMFQYGTEVVNGSVNRKFHQAMAISRNGPEGPWEKPILGCREGVCSNVVISDIQSFSVYYDTYAGKFRGAGHNRFGSADNQAQWELQNWLSNNDTSTSLIRYQPFSVNAPFIAFVRDQNGLHEGGARRRVSYVTSGDFQQWTTKNPISMFDGPDGWTQPYALSVTVHGNKLVGLLWWLHLDYQNGNNSIGTLDAELVWATFPPGSTVMSQAVWNRTYQPFLSVGATGSFDAGMIGPAPIIIHDNTVYIYYTAMKQKHGIVPGPGESTVGLATMPLSQLDSIIQ